MKDVQVRYILRHHRDGGPISRLYATGEITEHTDQALWARMADLTLDGRDAEADQIRDVIDYVNAVGARPPVSGWTRRR
ncbi:MULTISPECIES: hypothetical protein [Streptomyces]|uniref:hypothetical protein n=1 Tax=Streptomyces TaxID=1883 RepID=UPI0016783A65|nr:MULTISPECIES: hypothetical protein [Streptomyces]MBK3524848.1 hypothetical protein [Streptomyces sp. MBT70]GGR70953.1 hypothetical protein GCM10010236_26510 [Streptomyces eurythermus]